MTLSTLVIEAAETAEASLFYKTLGVDQYVEVRPASEPSTGFRGFSISLICSQPANVDALFAAAVSAGAAVLKPAAKSFWGYGAVVQAPDGTIWKLASSSKKDKTTAAAVFDDIVLLLGVEDVKASKQFYVDQGFGVAKSFGGKYAELESSPVNLALYPRKAAANDSGTTVDGSGSHRLVIVGDNGAFTDPDGFVWESR